MKKSFSIFKHRDVLAIDLSGHHLKIAHAHVSNMKREIVRLIDHNIKGMPDDEIGKVLENYVEELGVKNPDVFCAMPNQAAMTKNIEVPSRDVKEVEEIINLQAGRHTPFSREEIVVDYINIGVYKQTYTKILLIIASRNVIARYLKILGLAGLKVKTMVFCPEALAVVYPTILKIGVSASPIVLAYIDDEYTDFNVILKNTVLFVRSMPIGAEHFTADKEASEAKFMDEIKLSMDAYQSENIESVPINIYILGATEGIRDLENKLNDNLHIPAKIVPYFSHLPISDKAVSTLISGAKRLSFLNVAAPILSAENLKVNLLPEEVKFRHKLEERSGQIVKAGIHVIMIMIIFCVLLVSKIYFRSAYVNSLEQKISNLTPEVGTVEKGTTQVRLVKDYLSNQGYVLNVMSEIHSLLPNNTYLSDVKISEDGKFSIRGISDSMSSVFTFIGILEASDYFANVEAKYTSKRKEGDKDVAIFEIEGDLKTKVANAQ